MQPEQKIRRPLSAGYVRLTYSDSTIVHFRQSGNAPEIRCYVETDKRVQTEKMLGHVDKLRYHNRVATMWMKPR